MENKSINFVLDKRLNELNEDVEKLIFNINNPLAGERIHVIKTFTKEVIKAYAKEELRKVRTHPAKEAVIISSPQDFTETEFNLPPAEEIDFDLPEITSPLRNENPLSIQDRPFSRPKVQRQTGIKESLPKPKPKTLFKPIKIPEERINLITSKITNEEMAYAIKKGMFYVIHESELNEDEIKVLDGMKPSLEKKKDYFQNKEKFIKIMKRAARKNKVRADELSPSKLRYFLIKHLVNFGLVDPLINDPKITKIMCNGPKLKIKILREGEEFITNLEFKSNSQVNSYLMELANRKGIKLSEDHPIADIEFENFNIHATYGTEDIPSKFVLEKVI